MKDLHEPIESDVAKPKDLDDKKQAQLNQKAVGTIRSRIYQSEYHHVGNETKADIF